ncbi:hypothetical protein [Lentzea kentuckyensis]|uniref:hypothetical protein n=1 Tax=Lentzea kentuckyensis TaxID=360086 RepID=UPI000A375C7D|nr:hypothetical protein [Lentzea kentuckyensis]
MAGLPLLFLDVDGPLLPFGDGVAGTPGLSRLDPMHGPWLAALPCELIWATTWMDDANDPRHGLTDADYLKLDAWLRTATELTRG